MKAIFLFITFNLLCPFSLAYAMPSCEEAWTVKKPGLIIKAKIFFKMSLAGEDLTRMDLRGEDLESAKLAVANLHGADLRGVDLVGADLREADLRLADLRGANLRDADLRWAGLAGADLRGAILTGARVIPSQAEYLRTQDISGFVVEEKVTFRQTSGSFLP